MNKTARWTEDRYNPLYYLVHVAKVALPLYPQFGTEPNGYYIPPRWVPRPYLKQMFGPGVDQAIERYSAPDRELLAVLAALPPGSTASVSATKSKKARKIYETKLRGKKFDSITTPSLATPKTAPRLSGPTVEEPLHVRPNKHANSI